MPAQSSASREQASQSCRGRRAFTGVWRRPGVALLEVIVAIAILATAGVAALSMAAATTRAVSNARDADRELRDASAFLEAVSLWTRTDLDQRLGDRSQGPWILRIDRPANELYVVTLSDTLSGETLLSTSLFRPRGVDDPE